MTPIRQQTGPICQLVVDSAHCFFGYYDLQPWSADGRWHLCHRVPFMDRLPLATDRAELGAIRLSDHTFVPLTKTLAWNFQQGAMLQWNPQRPNDEMLYNSFLDGGFRGVAQHIETGARRTFPRPLANVSADGRRALSVNFSRLFDFRPGYGYAALADPFAMCPAPANDGVYLFDLETGGEKLILSLAALAEVFAEKFGRGLAGVKVLVNHLTFNPSGNRFVFLLRSMALPGEKTNGWLTMLATVDVDGENMHVFDGFGGASHYCWRDDGHLLVYADLPGRGNMQLCLVEDRTQEFEVLDPKVFSFDGHCSYSPDLRFILYDSYPDADCYRKLLIYDTVRRCAIPLAELYSVPTPQDARCDLHPRWSRDGSSISFDSTHEGERAVYTMDMREFCHEV